ncbi:NirA family protein [Methylopila sp. Yamaguchi]|uniref:NirA family protein n=1 Tax=Methylopila sp. Yamaguchi TaxID=1437817 RepID=UPI000CA7F0B8|nr:NirA family protein [Methylopila sp. Yamaguchi]GBD47377.1 NAD(P)H-dependent nitrite reductase catalytic subunit [Methylopila sp. Yamaguchi]
MTQDFSPDQKRYLEGFVSGVQAIRGSRGAPGFGGGVPFGGPGAPAVVEAEPAGPDAIHLKAMAAQEKAGKKLVPQEKAKREEHPFDAYARLKDLAEKNQFAKSLDDFRIRFHGLFYVGPTQDAYMCRLRIHNGILKAWQFRGVADLSERYAGGFTHVTTRANLQAREISAANGIPYIEGLVDIGLTSKGSGADNIRNVTGTPTAGIDPQELVDTRPYAKEWHHHILNDRALYGLPRKFNVAFDGAGRIAALEDTNDIGFQAVEVLEGAGVAPGVWWRLALGGITGHKDFARDTGVIVPLDKATKVADAIVRVFIASGDRSDRNKARLKYVLDAWGFETFLAEVEKVLGWSLTRVSPDAVAPRLESDRLAHIGVHPQKQPGLNWVGVVLPLGKMTCAQMRSLADISERYGDGDVRLTVWQNLLLSGVRDADVAAVEQAIAAIGLATSASNVRAGLVACTGNRGCKFAASDTKGFADLIANHVDGVGLAVDTPVNIHVTGCHNSCAQHYIGDIGLIGAKVPINDEDTVEGFHLHVGGGFGSDATIGRELLRDVKGEDCPAVVEKMLRGYLAARSGAETFAAFTRRHEIDALKTIFELEGA